MLNIKRSQVKKNIERKKYFYIVNVLKKFVGATTISKHILDLEVNVTVGKLLTSAPAIKKQLIKAFFEDEGV